LTDENAPDLGSDGFSRSVRTTTVDAVTTKAVFKGGTDGQLCGGDRRSSGERRSRRTGQPALHLVAGMGAGHLPTVGQDV
jgi:hypothetical protein